jgi:multiple sugar transport system substrate-binding protein
MNLTRLSRSVILLVSALLLIALPAGVFAADKAQSITFMTPPWGAPPDTAALKAFSDGTGIQVEVLSLPMDQLYTKVQVATSAGQKPADVIFLSEEAPSYIVAPGFVAPLDSLVKGDKEISLDGLDRVDFWTVKGKLYGIPSYVQLVMMDYNAAKLRKAGYAKPPTTWAELRTEAAQIKAKGVDQYPIAFGAVDWSWYLIALSMGDPMFDASLNPVFSNPGSKARAAMALLLGFFKDGLISPAMLSESTPHSVFMGGTGVFHQSWQGANGLMNNPASSKQAPDVRYMVFPEAGNTWSLDAALGISSKSTAMDSAWKFIKWYVGDANQRAIFKAFGLIPAGKKLQAALSAEGKIAEYSVLQAQAKHVNQLPRYATWWGPWTAKVTELLRQGIQGSMSADQVVDAIAQDWNDRKAEYGGK